jgi:hypothetical protein
MLHKSRVKFHFHIPEYNAYSNGIKTLWEAAYEFSKLYQTTISSFYYGGLGETLPVKFSNLLGNPIDISQSVIIYPDCIEGNPLQAKFVARFLMAKPMILNGKIIGHGESDFVFSYSHAVNKELPQYNLLLDELRNLKKIEPRKDIKQASIYYGKCRIGSDFKKSLMLIANYFDSFKIITRTQPNDKDILYQNISNSGLFISLDPLTSLCYESTLLGTPTLILDPVFKNQYDEFNYPLHDFYYDVKEGISAIKTLNRRIINSELEIQLNSNCEKTKIIAMKIISHFSQDRIVSNYSKDIELIDRKFYEELWRRAPIYNCTNAESIIRFHLINRNIYFYIFSKLLLKVRHLIINLPKKILSSVLSKEDYSYIGYLVNRDQVKNLSEYDPTGYIRVFRDVISISKHKLKLIWSI